MNKSTSASVSEADQWRGQLTDFDLSLRCKEDEAEEVFFLEIQKPHLASVSGAVKLTQTAHSSVSGSMLNQHLL